MQLKEKQIVKMISFSVSLLLLAGCVGMPWEVREITSEFDGSTEVSVGPVGLCDGSLSFSLYKRSNMPPGEIMLVAQIHVAELFADGPSLHFNIDGERVSFSSIDTLTDIKTNPGSYYPSIGVYLPASNTSAKRYIIDQAFLKRIIDAKRVVIRIDLQKTFAEGIFSKDCPGSARPAFNRFYERITR